MKRYGTLRERATVRGLNSCSSEGQAFTRLEESPITKEHCNPLREVAMPISFWISFLAA